MGNLSSTATTLESSLTSLSFESLEDSFNQVVTGKDPADPTTKLMTRADFAKQFPTFSSQKLFGQPSFNLFDLESLESIDFSSFFGGLTILLNSKVDTKIDALFRLLDPAGNGVLQEYELLGFVEKTLVHLQQIDPSIHWNEKITFDPTVGGKDTDTQTTPTPTTTLSPTPLNVSSSNLSASTSNININGNTANNADETFSEIPLAFGPVNISMDSQELVNRGLTAIGKNGKNTSGDAAPAARVLNKREFNDFIQKSPQLYFVVMWVLNLSAIQHICTQTRNEFINQCELQLCPLFPMKETQLIEAYTKLANFFYEILLRRLSIVNTIQPGSLLQQDLIVMEQHFNLTSNQANIEAATAPTSTTHKDRASPSRRTSSSRLSFSRQPDGTSLLDEEAAKQQPNALLSLKINPVNFPYTHHLNDAQILQSTFSAPIVPANAPTVAQFTPLPPPRVGRSTSFNNNDSTSLSRTPSGLRDSHGSMVIGASSIVGTGSPLPYNTPHFLQPNQKAPFSIPLSSAQLTTTDPMEFVKQNHPGTVQFTLFFLRAFKLSHLLHRNRLASKVLCHDLIATIESQLNSSYVDLITSQYIYETQTQYTKKTDYRQQQQTDGNLNQRLMLILNERKKNNGNNGAASTPPAESKVTTTASTTKDGKKVVDLSDDDDDDDDNDDDDDSDSLSLGGLQLSDDDDEFGDDSDIEDPEALFGTKKSAATKPKKSKAPKATKAPKASKSTKVKAAKSQAKPDDATAKDGEHKEGAAVVVSLDDMNADECDDRFGQVISPGHEALLTEAIIPNFLTQCTRAIQRQYITSAKGPYAMPYLTRFLKTYIPDALGQLLAAYRYVLSKKIREQVQVDHQALLVDIQDYMTELLVYKETFKSQLQILHNTITELEESIGNYKSQHEDLSNELLLTKEQNMILKTELTDVISVKDMAIITLRDELQFFSKESQHWSDQISKLNLQIAQLKQEKIQKDVEVAQLRSQKDASCCTIM